jgi:hypothetical protein
MKKIKIMCLLLVCILSLGLFASCGKGNEGDSASTPTSEGNLPQKDKIEPLPSDKIYSVLFIGNSYTKRYNMATEIFLPMAQAAGYAITSEAIVNGGHTLEEFANPNDTFGAKVAKALSEENYGKYDYVILQEQSTRPIVETAKFYEGVRALSQKIKAIGATPVLYATWGRKTGSQDLATLNLTNESMTWKLAATYNAIAQELDIRIAFAGLAFYDVYTNTTIGIYDDDLYHPVYAGSYLVAATIFAEIFNMDPRDIDFIGDGTISSGTAKELRKAAYRAVFETPEIPEEYVVSSEGVGRS